MRITCPQCHSRCRLKSDTAISDLSQGKCPECGHIFPIPPGVNREPSAEEHTRKQKKTECKTTCKRPDIATLLKPLRLSGRASLLWVISCFCLSILLAVVFIGPAKISPPKIEKNLASSSSPTTAETATKLNLAPQTKAKAIAQIKHHALVGDADISIADNHLQLAMLVAGNTPVAYAERLGRQFAHYLKEQLTATQQQKQTQDFKISVYYPSGTRITVATNNQSGEEEVLPQMINE